MIGNETLTPPSHLAVPGRSPKLPLSELLRGIWAASIRRRRGPRTGDPNLILEWRLGAGSIQQMEDQD
jgi:hypothetical protein